MLSEIEFFGLEEIIIPDNIGTIGNTHGVKDNKRPERKNPNKVKIKL